MTALPSSPILEFSSPKSIPLQITIKENQINSKRVIILKFFCGAKILAPAPTQSPKGEMLLRSEGGINNFYNSFTQTG